jgi:MFS superfamily sulfate permease-like transporter
VLGVIPGIGLAIVLAVIEFLWDGWRPHFAVLGRVEGIRGYHDIKRYPDARLVPGLVLFRWDAPLFFANAELFHERVLAAVAASPTPVQRFVVSAEPVTSIDITSADMLAELEQRAARRRHRVALRGNEGPGARTSSSASSCWTHRRDDSFYPTLGAAVDAIPRRPCRRTGRPDATIPESSECNTRAAAIAAASSSASRRTSPA